MRNTTSQARPQAVLTATPRAPLDGTKAGPQLRNHLYRGVVGTFPGISNTTRTALASQGTGGPNITQSTQPVSHQSELSSLAIMKQMNQIMVKLQTYCSPKY
ncbi:hypothetical protein O181_115692 [Austropuccinia psidii MF-1]|uniref:Uncharacterized protein n=1 Tax=Austropuccinia psidii MF-1 TaxID=1389203 RepID=A0A9Q3PXM4_9BASI|nr:hypothetical protein [Austropuccinia psidii MF-1]